MQYICIKQLTIGEVIYHPGEIISDGIILPERRGKLIRSGYVAEMEQPVTGVYNGTIQIFVKDASDEEDEKAMAISAKPEEIKQVFDILQRNTEEGVKIIANIRNENVLILLHATDNRKTIKNAVKEQADKLFSDQDIDMEEASS